MTKNKLISIIMPLYNHEKYVKKSIFSVLRQTYKYLELIIIDDGSTDKSASIVKKIKDKRIVYIYQKNKGVRKLDQTLNKGLRLSRGKFVTMMPSDDYWPKNRLSRQIMHFNDKNICLVFGNMTLVNEKNEVIKKINMSKYLKDYNSYSKEKKIVEYLKNNYIPQPTVLIRSSKLKKIGGYQQKDYMYAEDYPTQLHLILTGDFKYINANFAFYRIHNSQMTKNHTEKMIKTDIRFVKEFYKKIPRTIKKKLKIKYSELYNALQKKLYDGYFDMGRTHLFLKNRKKANNFFLKGIKYGSLYVKLKSIAGYICSLLKIDLEFIIKKVKY
jgi:glycosyltransferase involved in cell wall biosynthesis